MVAEDVTQFMWRAEQRVADKVSPALTIPSLGPGRLDAPDTGGGRGFMVMARCMGNDEMLAGMCAPNTTK
jgi:hypothetical protein